MKISRITLAALLSVALGGFSLAAQAADGAIKVTSLAEVDVVTVGKDGKKSVKRGPAATTVPGTEVIFSNVFENISTKTASGIVINNPVPNNTAYKGGSAMGKDTIITFSADGGKTFDEESKLTVVGADGKKRAAVAGDYTHIRWAYKGQLPPGKSGDVSFKAVIK